MKLSEAEFVKQFEAATLPPEDFHHIGHVRLAWIYLRDYPAIEALQRFCKYLKQFAASHGHQNLYHETITWAYFFLIQERTRKGNCDSFEDFIERNADLLDWKNSILKKYYSEQTLNSDLARAIFLFPDQSVPV